jgi:hypothetical protein
MTEFVTDYRSTKLANSLFAATRAAEALGRAKASGDNHLVVSG